ncbi:MAG: micrococcal nuclease, partial [Methylophagaceae bacterium]
MKPTTRILILISLILQANFLAADIFRQQDNHQHICFSDTPSASAARVQAAVVVSRSKHYVAKVYDGDTITLKNGERVRLLGINTPEIESRYRQGESGGQTAKRWLQEKLNSGVVFLECDTQQRDKYKRLLAHLFLESGEHLNIELVEAGLATLSIIPPNLKYIDEFKQAEFDAQTKDRGIWSMTEYQPISVEQLPKKLLGWRRFLATAKEITKTRKYVHLILNNNIDVRIAKVHLALFANLNMYLAKPLEIRGWASKSKGHYSILVRHT